MQTILIRARLAAVAAACLGLVLLAGACGSRSGSGPAASTTPAATATPASNGVASKPPGQILKAAKRALAAATSVHVRGNVRSSGEHYTVDLVVGHNVAKGSMTGPIAGAGRVSFDFIVTGGKMYIHGSRAVWRKIGGESVASLLAGRWVILPKQTLHGFPFVSAATLTHSLTGGSSGLGKARSVGSPVMINGQQAIPVKASHGTVYVATTGTPYPLRIVPKPNKQHQVADFLDYNAPVAVTTPPNPIDVSKMGH